jgi:hypothetical protein
MGPIGAADREVYPQPGAMQAAARQRAALAVLAGLAALAAGLVPIVAAGPAAAGAPSDELPPDLKVLALAELYVQRDDGRPALRFSHTTGNLGPGPLEIEPDPATEDCDGRENSRYAVQNIWRDANGSGSFERDADAVARSKPVGCMFFHAPHDHYHFGDFARYRLLAEGSGKVVRRSEKVSFCVVDSRLVPGLPGAPPAQHYALETCNSPDGVHGITPGWADFYSSGTPGQELRVGGLGRGRYCLELATDPEDRLAEGLREQNNVRRVRIALRPARLAVRRLDGACRVPS